MLHVLEYTVKMQFAPGAKDPSRLFLSMGKMIDAFRRMDLMLAKTAGHELTFVQTLESFQSGSFISKIKESFEYVSQESLSDAPPPETVNYIRESRRKLLTTLRDNPKIEDIEPITKVAKEIEDIAREKRVQESLIYRPIQPIEIADSLAGVVEPTRSLQDPERVTFQEVGQQDIAVPPESSVATHKIEEALIHRKISITRDIILKIKRPDYLGEAMWDFKHGKNTIQAKVLDAEWLEKFHNKEVLPGPGDSLEVSAVITEEYDKHGNLIRDRYEIAKVNSIIAGDVDEE